MKTLTRMFAALTFLLATTAQAATLYTAPLRASTGDTFVCHVLSVSSSTLPEVFVDIVMVNGTGASLIGGSCTGMGLGDDCSFELAVSGPLDVYCKMTVKSKNSVRANLTVVNSAGETISSTRAE
jgi:hypothetical protein